MKLRFNLLFLLFGACLSMAACGESNSSSETCTDGVKNQNETGIDCGGICSKCPDGQGCLVDSDCSSENCTAGTCASSSAPSCSDNVQNQDETDIDCGGQKCPGCVEGKHCGTDTDCQQGQQLSCADGICTSQCVADCSGKCGGVSDGCDGTCDTCPSGQWCDAQSCKVCNSDSHCGESCTDCTSQDSNRACVNAVCGCVLSSDCKESEVCRNGTCLELIECSAPGECPEGNWCDIDAGICVHCDSDNHCGQSCTDCTSQRRDKVCIDGVCACATNDHCAQGESCQDGHCICTDGELTCEGNTVRICSGGVWNDLIDCTVSGQVCIDSACQEGIICSTDDECMMFNMVCQDGHCAPAPCGSDIDCDEFERCQEGTCICEEGITACHDNMVQSCLDSIWNVLDDCTAQGMTCVEDHCEVNPLCPAGQQCENNPLGGQQRGCLDNGMPPSDAEMGCDAGNPFGSCMGNSTCYEFGAGLPSVCIERCGLCPEGQVCTNVSGDGSIYFCLNPDGTVPPDAQIGCDPSDPANSCQGNAACLCVDPTCGQTLCLFNCSAPH